MALSNNMIGAAGEYYVCAELCRKNILALLTPKNNPLFDVVASTPDGRRSISIQVKTMSILNKQGWKLGLGITIKQNNPNLFIVLVNMHENGRNDYYVYPYDDLVDRINEVYEDYMNTPKRDGGKRKAVKFRWFDFRYFTSEDYARLNAWDLLGLNEEAAT